MFTMDWRLPWRMLFHSTTVLSRCMRRNLVLQYWALCNLFFNLFFNLVDLQRPLIPSSARSPRATFKTVRIAKATSLTWMLLIQFNPRPKVPECPFAFAKWRNIRAHVGVFWIPSRMSVAHEECGSNLNVPVPTPYTLIRMSLTRCEVGTSYITYQGGTNDNSTYGILPSLTSIHDLTYHIGVRTCLKSLEFERLTYRNVNRQMRISFRESKKRQFREEQLKDQNTHVSKSKSRSE